MFFVLFLCLAPLLLRIVPMLMLLALQSQSARLMPGSRSSTPSSIFVVLMLMPELSTLPFTSAMLIPMPRLLTLSSASTMPVSMPGLSAPPSAMYFFNFLIVSLNQNLR